MTTNGHRVADDDKTARIKNFHRHVLDTYCHDNPASIKYNTHAKDLIPTGATRGVLSYDPFPLAFASGHDVFVKTLDGHDYLDLVSEYCAGMYGHSHPVIKQAIESVLDSGHSLGGCNPKEAELAELLISRFPSIEKIRFCNSGNEANLFAVATALAFTNRKKVMVFGGGYHGGSFMFPAHGSRLNIPHQFVQGVYNDVEYNRSLLQQHQDEIGAILVEPMQGAGGSILGTEEFLQLLRCEASRTGAVLIFDEVITSRLYYGGLQEYFGIIPDMTTVGKHFGGGLAFGAFGGKSDLMKQYEADHPSRLFHSGTWNNNRFTMTAGAAGTRLLTREALSRTSKLGEQLRDRLRQTFDRYPDCPGYTRGFGSQVGFGFTGPNADVLREALFYHMARQRIYTGFRGFIALNILHDESHVERAVKAVEAFCEEVFG